MRLSMNRPGHRIVAWRGKAALKTHALQTLRDCRASPNRAKRLECGSVRLAEPVRFIGAFRLALDGQWFMVPMHAEKRRGLSTNPGVLPASCRQTNSEEKDCRQHLGGAASLAHVPVDLSSCTRTHLLKQNLSLSPELR